MMMEDKTEETRNPSFFLSLPFAFHLCSTKMDKVDSGDIYRHGYIYAGTKILIYSLGQRDSGEFVLKLSLAGRISKVSFLLGFFSKLINKFFKKY